MNFLSLERRLQRLESYRRANGKKVYVFTIDNDRDFETEEELQEELKNPKYDGCTILIENLKEMRKMAAEYNQG